MIWLVVSTNPSEKYGKTLFPIYMENMFEITNQLLYGIVFY